MEKTRDDVVVEKGIEVFKKKNLISLENIEMIFGVIGGAVLFFIMILISADILVRALFNKPMQVAFELVELLMIFVIFFGIPHAQREGNLVRIEILISRFSGLAKRRFEYFNYIFSIVFFIIFCWQNSIIAWDSIAQDEISRGLVPLPLYPSRIGLVLGSFIMIAELLRGLIDLRRGKE